MYKEIYKLIRKYNTIVIARHIGVDPDALSSQLALRDSIRKTFPKKNVYAVGNGSIRLNYIGKLDKLENRDNALLIVLDTPDKKRVDFDNLDGFAYKIKIDHHPFIEEYCDLELINDLSSSTAEMILTLLTNTKLKIDKSIAEKLFIGIVSDTNRFLYGVSCNTFNTISKLLKKYKINTTPLYEKIYLRPLSEIKLQGYMSQNMEITSNGVGYIKIPDDIITKLGVDSASSGNLINNFNFIEEALVWLTISEDKKNEIIRISIRSRGPEINHIAERYNGGGHKFASGARVKTFEEAFNLVEELDLLCGEYNKMYQGEDIFNED